MEKTTCNPDKGRLVSHEVQYTPANTIWFEEDDPEGVYPIRDIHGALLIREPGYRTPLLI